MYFKLLLFLYIHTATGQPLTCEENQFKCMHRCIPISWRCDGDYDCVDEDDKTDEENCRKCDFFIGIIIMKCTVSKTQGHVSWLLANRMKRQNPTRTKSVGYLGKKMKYHLFRLLRIYKHV